MVSMCRPTPAPVSVDTTDQAVSNEPKLHYFGPGTAVIHDCLHLVELFEHCFYSEFNTCLVPGGSEPEYLPAGPDGASARIVFTYDYFASALHEIAHWCVAGAERRRMPDYGYWYAPDGRSPQQQAEFERVEVKPQAMEWLFAEAAGYPFRVSADNLNQGLGASESFKAAITAQAQAYYREGLPRRARCFYEALTEFYRTSPRLAQLDLLRL